MRQGSSRRLEAGRLEVFGLQAGRCLQGLGTRSEPAGCCLAAAVAWFLVSALPALDFTPTGVVAVLPEKDGEDPALGGAAVVLSAEGQALTLEEVVASSRNTVRVALPGGGRRLATVAGRGRATGAVLLHITLRPTDRLDPLVPAASDRLTVGQALYAVGNTFGSLALDGRPSLSRGIVSGLYAIPKAAAGQRGRGGQMLSAYTGPALETDAAINDGDQGAALVDAAGRLLALASLGVAPERRLGIGIPVQLLLADLGLAAPVQAPTAAVDPCGAALVAAAQQAARSLALVYMERPSGPGNPPGMEMPELMDPGLPEYQRRRQELIWEQYYHYRQLLYTDQAVSALVVDPAEGLLLTAASNLHGGATRGRVLRPGAPTVPCELVARDLGLDLALLRCSGGLDLPAAPLAPEPGLAAGDPVGVVGRHGARDGHTLTRGVVSATDRRLWQAEYPLHQTDAAVNYGSLGGAVVDLRGQVVGMVVMLGPHPAWPWLINSGVGIFVDSRSLLEVLGTLRRGEERPAGRMFGLGVGLRRLPDRLEVETLVPGTGAERVLRPGDVILAVDGQVVAGLEDLSRALIRHRAGQTVPVRVLRDGAEAEVGVELTVFDRRGPDHAP